MKIKSEKNLKKLNKKAQGLPVNFIVIVIIAVVVLLGVIMFFLGGFRTEAMDIQTAINVCDTRCLSEARHTATIDSSSDYSNPNSQFCGITQEVAGYTGAQRCNQITTCRVNFRDGSNCVLNCTEGTSSCSTTT